MRASAMAVAAILLGAGVGAGCDWRDFDTLQKETPVLAVSAPSGASSNDFGSALLAVAPPANGTEAAWFIASGTTQTSLSVVTLSASGSASATNVQSSVLVDLNGFPVTALAEIPGTGQALGGSPQGTNGGKAVIIDMAASVAADPTTNVKLFTSTSLLEYSESQYGVGVAAGSLGGAATPDLVIASAQSVHVFIDEATTDLAPTATDLASCPISLSPMLASASQAKRAVAIVPGAVGPLVAVGTPVTSGAGSVSLFTVDATAKTVSCAAVLAGPQAADSGFGVSMAVGDVTGDGVADLVVGAPPNRVYVYKGPLAAGATPLATITPQGTILDFGAAVAAFDVDGLAGDEVVVGDPDAAAGGTTGGGVAYIYASSSFTQGMTVLQDHSPASGEAYGTSVGGLPFCAVAPCASPPVLPLVGAPSKVFVYFELGATDPRVQ
jgi:hypothetical protein